jgi:hypothetical protein
LNLAGAPHAWLEDDLTLAGKELAYDNQIFWQFLALPGTLKNYPVSMRVMTQPGK